LYALYVPETKWYTKNKRKESGCIQKGKAAIYESTLSRTRINGTRKLHGSMRKTETYKRYDIGTKINRHVKFSEEHTWKKDRKIHMRFMELYKKLVSTCYT
jgi:hypothetical protein